VLIPGPIPGVDHHAFETRAEFATPTQHPRGQDGASSTGTGGLLTGNNVEDCKQRWTHVIEDKYTVRKYISDFALFRILC
jgi:hypothetical protein